jgi:hypothetical protein
MELCESVTIKFKYYNKRELFFFSNEFKCILKGEVNNCDIVDAKPAYRLWVKSSCFPSKLNYAASSFFYTVKESDAFDTYDKCEEEMVKRYKKLIKNSKLCKDY